MVDPFSLILGGLSILGNAAGTVVKAGAQRRQAQFDSFYNEQNALLAGEAATDATIRGAIDAGYHRMQGSAEIGAMTAAYGASGVDGTSGSAADAIASTRMVNELEARVLENNAAREARGYRIEEFRSREQAKADKKRGQADFVSTLLNGGGDVAESTVRLGSSIYGSRGAVDAPYGEVRSGYGSGRGITGGEK